MEQTFEKNLNGFAVIDAEMFTFCPDNPVPGQVAKYKSHGTGIQLSDGSFEFVVKRTKRARSKLIKKLAHGRVSRTIDHAVQLTLKIYDSENVDSANAIVQEALNAADAIRNHEHIEAINVTFSKLP